MNENNHAASTFASAKTGTAGSSWSRFWSRFVAEPEPSIAHRLYEPLVRHARFPIYFERLDVPDTPEGRFEVLALHVGLVMRRLCGLDEEGRAAGQALFDLMVADLDGNLRELGVGDLSVGKQVKRLAGQFYARLAVLDEAFDEERPDALVPMLETNVFGAKQAPQGAVAHLAAILQALEEALASQSADDVKAGRITLPDEAELVTLGGQQPRSDDG
ncbi:MAG: ubiquinol-cytochrome C chaperone family protein [Geminicoccaceae bacterium]